MSLPRLAVAAIACLLLTSATMYAAETASCDFTTFSAPPGYSLSTVSGVSDDGTVVGQLVDNKTQKYVGFMYSANGVFTEYTAPKSAMTWMYGNNASGTNAGSYEDSAYPGTMHGFVLQGSNVTVVNYPKATNTWLFDVNQVGTAAGSFTTGTDRKGFVLSNGTYTSISYPKAQLTYAQGISDNGVVAGSGVIGYVSHGFLWQNGKFTDIDYPNAKYGTALMAVNKSGVVAGNHFSAEFSFGFIYENGVFKNIKYPGAKYASTGGINNNGLVSGLIYFKSTNLIGYTAVCK